MKYFKKKQDDIIEYIEDREYIANKYVMKCFTVCMLIYSFAFVLNTFDIFIIDKFIYKAGYFPSLIIYGAIVLIQKKLTYSNKHLKCFLLLGCIVVHTIMGATLTYHVVLVSLLPFLYATLYTSKKVMYYVYAIVVVSTFIVVHVGYYYGLCDANMALLTSTSLGNYNQDGYFSQNLINESPWITLTIYYVFPRCLIYIAFASVCNTLYNLVSGSIEKAKLSDALEKAKEEAERANKAKSQFLAKMSHEIRTPINAVLGMNEMIIREAENDNVKNYAQDVKDSSNLLLSIINEILDSSKIESGMMEIVEDEYDMSVMLNDLHNMIEVKAHDKNLDLEFDIDEYIPSKYFGDDKRIRQVLINMLTNGVKYTEKGSVTLKLSGRTEGDKAILDFAVIDTGIGIKEEDIANIYDAFKRIDVSRNKNVEGTGLGMNIAQQLLKLMGSEVHIESEYEKGSVFSFTIEQKIIDATPLGDYKERVRQSAVEAAYRSGFTAPDAKILTVDDNAMNLKVFSALLNKTKIQITEAISGFQCLDLLETEHFDIVFLDHMMPEMDGIETLHAIKERKLCQGVPIIMLTANSIIGEKEKYLAEGFDDFLSKPILPGMLEKMILKYLPDEYIKDAEKKEAIEEVKETKLPQLDEFDLGHALSILQTEELVMKTLEELHDSIDPLEKRLDQLFESLSEEEQLYLYRVDVHALKSNAAMVGAMLLSSVARLLEIAAYENDLERIYALHPVLLNEMRKHKERIATILPEREEKKDFGSDAIGYFDMLEMSLSNNDYNSADLVITELKKYNYSDELQPLANDLFEKVKNLDADEAFMVIGDIREKL